MELKIVILLMIFSCARSDTVYPSPDFETIPTKLNCNVDEVQYFSYSSFTELWGSIGGGFLINADVAIHCLGNDIDGEYGDDASKYLAEISNLVLEERKEGAERSHTREKRDIGEFFSRSWKKVKGFFSRIFGGRRNEPRQEPSHPIHDDEESERKDIPTVEEEEEEDFNASDLNALYSEPFQFIQLANGSIPEILFTEEETDGRVKNFKRHLVDAFATQLGFGQREKSVIETSVMGEHSSLYNVTVNEHSSPLKLGSGQWTASPLKDPTIVVNKVVKGNDILKLAPDNESIARNNRDKMDLKVHQKQIFQGGRMISSSGTSSLALLHSSGNQLNRKKRDNSGDDGDVMAHLQAHSTFEMKLVKRQRRIARADLQFAKQQMMPSFKASSRFAEKEDNSERRKLLDLQKAIGNMSIFFSELLEKPEMDYDEKMQLLFEMVQGEIQLGLDQEEQSMSQVLRTNLSKELLQNMCMQNFTKCTEYLRLLALAGGREAEEVLLLFFIEDQIVKTQDLQIIADIISDVSRPSPQLLAILSYLLDSNELSPEVLGSLALAAGHLGFKASRKQQISQALIRLLEVTSRSCTSYLVTDVLEAMGNLGCENTIPHILKVYETCDHDKRTQIACINALRRHTTDPLIQEWIVNVTATEDCEIQEAIIGMLLDVIQEQDMSSEDSSNWPRHGINEVDLFFKNELLTKSPCEIEGLLTYFNKKNIEVEESEQEMSNHPLRREKRSFWDDVNCQDWTEDTKYRAIQDKEEFAADRATYNKRKSCLAFRRLGMKGANAEIYAGMFAGVKEPSKPPKYKLFTKFVSGLHFLGEEMEIGSFYFYHHTGRTKAYVRILGRTRQEFIHDGCTPSDLKYRPVKHIPLYLVSVSNVQLSLGIHLSSQLALNTTCPGEDQQMYQLQPYSRVRIGGEATGTVLFIRGSVNVGADFNYKLQFTFTPSPNMCLKGSHGYDPMNISLEAHYQLWNQAKEDWGKMRVWKPGFLTWDITRGALRKWFDDTCIATEVDMLSPEKQLERELE